MIRFTSNKSNFCFHQQRSVALKHAKNASVLIFSVRDTYVYVRYMLSAVRLSVCRLSVCNVGAPYSDG